MSRHAARGPFNHRLLREAAMRGVQEGNTRGNYEPGDEDQCVCTACVWLLSGYSSGTKRFYTTWMWGDLHSAKHENLPLYLNSVVFSVVLSRLTQILSYEELLYHVSPSSLPSVLPLSFPLSLLPSFIVLYFSHLFLLMSFCSFSFCFHLSVPLFPSALAHFLPSVHPWFLSFPPSTHTVTLDHIQYLHMYCPNWWNCSLLCYMK